MNFPITKPLIGNEEIEAVTSVLRSGWVTQGPKVEEFEFKFSELVGSKYSVAVSSCTAALHLSLKVIGISTNDEVIVPSLSFIASANAIRYCGAIPHFVDIERNSFNIDPDQVLSAINKKTKAILCVHQMGMPCNINRLLQISKEYSIPLIEDAACALGSRVLINNKWEHIGKPRGKIAAFSFHPRKVITTGDGGMLTTNDKSIYEQLKLMRQHGMSISDSKRHQSDKIIFEEYKTLGYNYRLTDIQASIGICQLKKLENIVDRRRKLARAYNQHLSITDKVSVPHEESWQKSNWQSYCVGIDTEQKSVYSIMEYLKLNGISTRRGIQCAHLENAYVSEPWQSSFTSNGMPKLKRSEDARNFHIILPLYDDMTLNDVSCICETLKHAVKEFA